MVYTVLSLDETNMSVVVTPLRAGPTLVLTQVAPASEWKNKQASPNQATVCPDQTMQVVHDTWVGGVTRADGQTVGEEAIWK